MTLFKQLILGISLLFFVLLTGVEAIYLASARVQLQEQLGSQAQDAATTLALRVATVGGLEDRVLIETMVNPVFDRGYFQEIRVVSVDGDLVVRKTLAPRQGQVPEWFAALFPIHAPSAQSLVSSGWRELGRIVVVSQPHFAYLQLWKAGLQTIAWLLLGYIAAIVAGIGFLAMLLRPLREIERAAIAIGARDFKSISFAPRARELARVVIAMNEMSGRIRTTIEEAVENADAQRRDAYIDPLTSLYNRRGFEYQLQSLIQSTADVYSCALVLVEIRNFANFNARVGYQRGDEVIAVLADTLTAACGTNATIRARLGGAGFALVAMNVDRVGLQDLVAGACHHIRRTLSEQGLDSELHFDCGATYREGPIPDLSELLASADRAVAQARGMGDNEFAIGSFDETASVGSLAWREYIERGIDDGAIALFAQDVIGLSDRQAVHLEVTVRLLRPDGAPLEAAQFLPMAVRHGLIGRLDCLVVGKLLAYLSGTPGRASVALNVAARTIADPEAIRQLLALLDERSSLASLLTFEMTEFGAMQDLELTKSFCGEIRRRGAQFALDNFSMRQDSLKLVHALRPQYIKLSVGYSREIAQSPDCRFLVKSIVRAVEPLGIRVFAQAVEDQGLVGLLAGLGLSGYQGYAASRPRQIA